MSGVLGFLIAIIILVSVHEYGHFIVARWCGVRVLRFSVGFGKPFFSRYDARGTEFCLAPIPLGGYVKFLDTREISDPVELQKLSDDDKRQAFDLQNVYKRIAIVFAGPLINFLLAFVLFSAVSFGEKTVLLPIIGDVDERSLVAQAGMQKGDQITEINQQPIETWNDIYISLIQQAIVDEMVPVKLNRQGQELLTQLPLSKEMISQDFSWQSYGLTPWQPEILPIIEKVTQQHGVQNTALQAGDLISAIDQVPTYNWQVLVQEIKAKPNQRVMLAVQRQGNREEVEVTLGSRIIDGQVVGFLGVQVALPKTEAWAGVMTTVNQGVFSAVAQGYERTLQVANLIITSVIGMFTGGVGLDNLGGPITIAKQAGQSAQIGISAFVVFLAFLSMSLGILNLLPIPLLDGGHIVLFLWEAISGKAPSDQWQFIFQRVGFSIVIALTVIALLNDIFRL